MKKIKKRQQAAKKTIKKAVVKKTAKIFLNKIKRVMSKVEMKKYKEALIKEREKVGGDLTYLTSNTLNKSQRESTGDLSGYSYHMADMATDDYDRDFSLGRATDEQRTIYRIDEAMKRVEDGSYGACQQCAKPISKKRLKAIPYVETCIDCQKKNDER